MNEPEWLSERFEQHRSHLHAVAYRMLGSTADADDALQDAWLRIQNQDVESIDNMQAWLTTVVGRVCLSMLRARRALDEKHARVHVPDPVVEFLDNANPEQEAIVADSVGLALLVVLDALTPAERLAFVLHDIFGVPFSEIATTLERSEAAAMQLASRARVGGCGGRRCRIGIWRGSGLLSMRSLLRRGTGTSRRSFGCSIRTSCSGSTAVGYGLRLLLSCAEPKRLRRTLGTIRDSVRMSCRRS